MKAREGSDQDTVDKWEVQLRKGCLELAILAALWDGKLYGLEILRRLESDSDLIVSEGTVYPLLSRLKALGLVRSEWVESDAGHPRKYYALTLPGRQLFDALSKEFELLISLVQHKWKRREGTAHAEKKLVMRKG